MPDGGEENRAVAEKELSRVCMVEIEVEYMTGKEGRNIVQEQI